MTRTKKLINDPDDLIAELIDGMVGAHPDLLRRAGATGRVIAAVDGPRPGKVGIVVGGGSGHEPLFSGYVGRGLGDACAVGNIFASPSPEVCAEAARAADGGAGVVLLYGNYTGDAMNFAMAEEALAAEGIAAASVRITDDVVSAPRKEERRGIAGDVFVFKIAGAAADLGHDMAEVVRLARHADARTASMGVALGPCSLPQTRTPNFEIGAEEMEIGMGLHGEPGIARIPLEPADAVADRLLLPLLEELRLGRGDRVAVLVNGLGSTALLELYILHRRVRQVLEDRGIEVHRSLVGPYATSLEMAGASVTLLHLDDDLEALLDHPCRTLAMNAGTTAGQRRVSALPERLPSAPGPEEHRDRATMRTEGDLTPARFRAAMRAVGAAIAADRDRLCRLDGAIGDGDHGLTMDIGWTAALGVLDDEGDATITRMSRAMARAFLDAVGASAGPLYATGLEDAAAAVADRLNLDPQGLAEWIAGLAAGIARRGGAGPGQKTMLDAWHPAAAAATEAARTGATLGATLDAAAQAARAGMEGTAPMQATKGRAAKLGARAVGHVDPGAASAVTILDAMAAALR